MGAGQTSLPPASPFEADGRSKRWLALGFVSVVYALGIAGLWSMVQTFDATTPPALTPAGDSETMPPLEETIEVRDARLDDGLFRPKFKPAIAVEADADIAASDLQKRI